MLEKCHRFWAAVRPSRHSPGRSQSCFAHSFLYPCSWRPIKANTGTLLSEETLATVVSIDWQISDIYGLWLSELYSTVGCCNQSTESTSVWVATEPNPKTISHPRQIPRADLSQKQSEQPESFRLQKFLCQFTAWSNRFVLSWVEEFKAWSNDTADELKQLPRAIEEDNIWHNLKQPGNTAPAAAAKEAFVFSQSGNNKKTSEDIWNLLLERLTPKEQRNKGNWWGVRTMSNLEVHKKFQSPGVLALTWRIFKQHGIAECTKFQDRSRDPSGRIFQSSESGGVICHSLQKSAKYLFKRSGQESFYSMT